MKPLQKSQEQILKEAKPLILLGMHRSGTSLVSRLLSDVGVFMGRKLSRDAEAVYFQKINRRIFNARDVRWGYVDPLIEAMRSQEFVGAQVDAVKQALFPGWVLPGISAGIADFFGADLWASICREEPISWGWKDPRTTLTFPIWLRVFPEARFLHILRNGIDVAISTHRRTERQHQNIWKRTLRLDYCPITLDFNYCFRLWETYINYVLENRDLFKQGQYMEIRYEDLLAKPEPVLEEIAGFANFQAHPEAIARAATKVNRKRLDNSTLASMYQDQIGPLADRPLMNQLGYHYTLQD